MKPRPHKGSACAPGFSKYSKTFPQTIGAYFLADSIFISAGINNASIISVQAGIPLSLLI